MRTQARLVGLVALAFGATYIPFHNLAGGGPGVDGVGDSTGATNIAEVPGTLSPRVARKGDTVTTASSGVTGSADATTVVAVAMPSPMATVTLKGGVVAGGDPPVAWSINDITWPTEWPVDCAEGAPHVVYAAASESRAIIVANTINEIGGCGLRVPVVLRTKIGLAVVPASRNFEVRYEGKVVMNVTKMMKGNPPNSATHFRLIATIAASKSLQRNTWAIIFEDDAQLHPDAAEWFPDAADKVALLQHSFKMADATKADRILYAHCISSMSGHADFGFAKMPKCQRLTEADVPGVDGPGGRYGNVSFAYCPHDYRCAHAYAMTKTGAQELTNAYTMLNRGDKMCPKGIWNGEAKRGHPRCSSDPMITTRYMYDCKGTPHYCKGLVVGSNMGVPDTKMINNSTNDDADGVPTLAGLFVQRRGDTRLERGRDAELKQEYMSTLQRDNPRLTKDELKVQAGAWMTKTGVGGAKHYNVRMMLSTAYVRKFFKNKMRETEIEMGPPDMYSEDA